MSDLFNDDLFGTMTEQQNGQQTASPAQTESPATTATSGPRKVDLEALVTTLRTTGKAKLSDHFVPEESPAEEEETEETTDDLPEDITEEPDDNDLPEDEEEDTDDDTAAEEEEEEEEETTSAPVQKTTGKKGKKEKVDPVKADEEKLMASLGMTKYLKDFLDKAAAENPEFAKVYANPNKNLVKMTMYIIEEVFKNNQFKGFASIRNDVIEGMALHYYQEESAEPKMDQPDNIALAVMLQGFPIPEEDMETIKKIALKAKRKEYVEHEAKQYADDIRSGKVKVELTEEEKKEIEAAGRQALIDQASEKAKKQSLRKQSTNTTAPTKKEDDTLSLF